MPMNCAPVNVTVCVPPGLARDLFGAFLGFDENDTFNNAELHDMVGEFGNMVCGTWLTSLARDECFDLAHPEVAVAGFNDLPASAWTHPRLTTIAIPRTGIGQEAARLLTELMGGRAPAQRTIDLGFELKARDST